MAQQKTTLFHLLSRQPWWVTLIVAGVVYALARLVHEGIAPFMAVPFVLLAIVIGFKQFTGGAPVNVEETLKRVREMPWEEFSAAVTEGYRRDGYTVDTKGGAGYDFRLVKDDRSTLLSCRRWKVAQVGVGPVRELATAIEKNEAANGICIAANEFSTPARDVAKAEPITLVSGRELAELVTKGQRKKRNWFWKG